MNAQNNRNIKFFTHIPLGKHPKSCGKNPCSTRLGEVHRHLPAIQQALGQLVDRGGVHHGVVGITLGKCWRKNLGKIWEKPGTWEKP